MESNECALRHIIELYRFDYDKYKGVFFDK